MPGLTLAAGGPDRVKITVGLGQVTGTATARGDPGWPRPHPHRGDLRCGMPMALLGSLRDITVPLPALPLRMTIKGVSVTGQGVLVHIADQNVSVGN